eukprot:COSAG01_NODE_108_length_25947_cov_25.489593_12_plen_157_part_00
MRFEGSYHTLHLRLGGRAAASSSSQRGLSLDVLRGHTAAGSPTPCVELLCLSLHLPAPHAGSQWIVAQDGLVIAPSVLHTAGAERAVFWLLRFCGIREDVPARRGMLTVMLEHTARQQATASVSTAERTEFLLEPDAAAALVRELRPVRALPATYS